jgi:hypothetical protein
VIQTFNSFKERRFPMTQAGLKAGAVGAGVIVVLNLIGLIPCVGCFTCILGLLAYVGVGALAAYWLPPVRTAGEGAGAGAIAGVVAGIVSGIVNMIIAAVQFAISGGPGAMMQQMRQLPPEVMNQLYEAGVDPALFASIGGVIGISAACCVIGFILAAVLGAIGGVIFAAAKPE